jgi:hypothetical protein
MTQTNIEFNKDTIELVNELAEKINANNTVQFEKKDGKVTIGASDVAESVVYFFKADEEHFNFTGDTCTFYNFPEFYNLVKSFENPEILQKDQTLIVKENRSKINYQLSDDDIVDDEEAIEDVEWDTTAVIMELSEDNISKISKMANAVEADKVKLSIVQGQATLILFNDKHENTFEEVFDVINNSGEDLDIVLEKDLFNKIPNGDYTVNINEDLLVQFVLKNTEGYTVNIFAGQMNEE